jgi:large subunit ribosomal protein L19
LTKIEYSSATFAKKGTVFDGISRFFKGSDGLTGELTVKTELLEAVENKSLRKKTLHFEVGDTVDVHCKIKEGDKERVQVFTGTVIARKGRGINEIFTVRRIVDNEGVERIFPLNSPNVIDVQPVQSGRKRRAKLYYLRLRTGKAVKLAHRHSEHTVTE